MPRTARSESRSPARTRFGRELERLLAARDLSIRQLAARTGANGPSRSYLSQLIRGATSDKAGARPVANPSAGTLWAIADALGLDRSDTRALFMLAGADLPVSLQSQDRGSPDRLALAGERGYALDGLPCPAGPVRAVIAGGVPEGVTSRAWYEGPLVVSTPGPIHGWTWCTRRQQAAHPAAVSLSHPHRR